MKILGIKTNRFQLLLIVMVLSAAGYYVHKYWYLPYKFKKEYYEGFRNDPYYSEISDENIKNFVECLYERFKYVYGNVSNFHNKDDYEFIDVKIIYTCGAKYIFDKEKSEFYLTHMDSLVNEYFIQQTIIEKEKNLRQQQKNNP